MNRWMPHPLLWAALVLLWLLLNQSLWLGHILLGAAFSFLACLAFARLETEPRRVTGRAGPLRRLRAALELLALVIVDMVRSNVAVARIVLNRATVGRTAGFLEVPLALRDPLGLALLAAIITATPGTAWTRYEPAQGILTMHILDLIDEATWIETIKGRYERRLLEIFE